MTFHHSISLIAQAMTTWKRLTQTTCTELKALMSQVKLACWMFSMPSFAALHPCCLWL